MKKQVSISTLQTRFVIKLTTAIAEDITDRSRRLQQKYPTGAAHIFEFIPKDECLVPFSFCGLEASKIGEECKTFEKLPLGITVCTECEQAWKADPRSPWVSWTKAVTS